MGERHVARHRHVAATDDASIGDSVVRRPEGTCGHGSGTCTGVAGDAVDAHGVERFRERYRRQEGGEPPRPGSTYPPLEDRAEGDYGQTVCISVHLMSS
jgi:hypothetical protein